MIQRYLDGRIDWVATSGRLVGGILAVAWFLFIGRWLWELVFVLTLGIGP